MQKINGKNISLRLVETFDAEFLFNLRKIKGQHLSKVESLERQVEWLSEYKLREGFKEFYFIIENKNERLGAVRLYNFAEDSFSWGSWIIKDGAPLTTALESALLVYDFAFNGLGLKICNVEVRKKNKKVIEFHERFGVKIKETDLDFYFQIGKEGSEEVRKKFSALLGLKFLIKKKSINIFDY